MRIVVVVTSMGGGGAERQVQMLATGLLERGHAVTVVTMRSVEASAPQHFLPRGVREHNIRFSTTRSLLGLIELRRLFALLRTDVAVAFNEPAVLASRLAVLGGGPVLVSSVRTSALPRKGRRSLLRCTRRLDAVTVFNSQRSLSGYVDAGLSEGSRSVVIPNALAPDLGTYVRPEQLPGQFRWLAVGRLTPAKGFDVLLDAVAALHGASTQVLVDIYGDGEQREALEAAILERGLVDVVRLVGFDATWLSRASHYDGFVLSSRWEGSPNAALEAVSVGIPAVATRVGNLEELLSDSRLAAPGSVEELCRAMRLLMSDEQAGRPGTELARDRTRTQHDEQAVLSAWERALSRAAARRADRPG